MESNIELALIESISLLNIHELLFSLVFAVNSVRSLVIVCRHSFLLICRQGFGVWKLKSKLLRDLKEFTRLLIKCII